MKKGFTLIELLAVIVILAIIALIAVPVILNIIGVARENSTKRSIDMYAKALQNTLAEYYLNNPSSEVISGVYSTEYLNQLLSLMDMKVDYTGDRVNCEVIVINEDQSIFVTECIVGSDESVIEYSYGFDKSCGEKSSKTFGSSCTYTDSNNSSSINAGDEVKCGTEEFYIVKEPSNGKITMMSKYNLNVKDKSLENEFKLLTRTYRCTDIGYQDEHVIGEADMEKVPNSYGSYSFWNTDSNYGYWTNGTIGSLNSNFESCTGDYCYLRDDISYPIYVIGKGGTKPTIEKEIDEYVEKFNEQLSTNATGRLITYNELVDLGCDSTGYSRTCNNAPSWVRGTNYWTSSASDYDSIWFVRTNGEFGECPYEYPLFGVRPVLEVSESIIGNN